MVIKMELKPQWRDMQDLLLDNIDNRVALMLVSGTKVNGVVHRVTNRNLIHLKEVSNNSRNWFPKDKKYEVVVPLNVVCGVVIYARRFKRGYIDKEFVDEDGVKRSESIDVERWVDVEYKDGKFVDVEAPGEDNVRWVN
jgi:hypothetical protein